MKLSFEVAGVPAEFQRNDWSGRAQLRVGDDLASLQSPARPSTHFEPRLRRVWQSRVGEHEIEIAKVRPRMFAGFRAQSFIISVDGRVVAEARGK
jgi:hypothetical protein